MTVYATLSTSGTGLWSTKAGRVFVTRLDLQYITAEQDFGELCVYFDTDMWDTSVDGLVYTDPLFLYDLRAYLQTLGFSREQAYDVDYSEQGMQSDTYVSCDVGAKFIARLAELDPEHVNSVLSECADV